MDTQMPGKPVVKDTVQRNMIIAAAVAVLIIIVAAILVTRDFKSADKDDAAKPQEISIEGYESGQVKGFEEPMCGFVVAENAAWSVDYNKGGGVSVVSGGKEVIIACAEEIPGIPLLEDRIEVFVVDGVEGKLYHDASPKDGVAQDDIRVRHPFKPVDVTVRGTPGMVAEVGTAIRWMK